MKRWRSQLLLWIPFVCMQWTLLQCACAQSLTWLGFLQSGNASYAEGVSDNGVVAGWAYRVSASSPTAFRWENGVMQDLGALPGYSQSYAHAISADGSVVTGYSMNPSGAYRAFRWMNGTMQDLGTLGGNRSEVRGVSANGTVAAGYAWATGGQYRLARWVNEAIQDLGPLGDLYTTAHAVSPEGNVLVGEFRTSTAVRAFRWENGVIQNLGTFPNGSNSCAFGVSANGTVVVGHAFNSSNQRRAVRWVNGLIHDLGTLGGNHAEARAVDSTGRIIVGQSRNALDQDQAMRWTAETGMQNLNQVYAGLLGSNQTLIWAYAISPNGRYIAGIGRRNGRTEAFLLDTGLHIPEGDVNRDGCVDDSDLLAVLFAFGSTGSGLPEDLNNDNRVDDGDLLIVLFNFGSGC